MPLSLYHGYWSKRELEKTLLSESKVWSHQYQLHENVSVIINIDGCG